MSKCHIVGNHMWRLHYITGEQMPVSVSGRASATKSISSDHTPDIQSPTPQENNVFDLDDEG